MRHILLAEPLAERFGDRFRGVSAERAAELASAFRFKRTLERTGLTSLLREHLAGD